MANPAKYYKFILRLNTSKELMHLLHLKIKVENKKKIYDKDTPSSHITDQLIVLRRRDTNQSSPC